MLQSYWQHLAVPQLEVQVQLPKKQEYIEIVGTPNKSVFTEIHFSSLTMPGCVVGGVCWLVGIGWGARGGCWLGAGGPCGGTCDCCGGCWGGTCCCVNIGGDTVVTVDRLGLPPDASDWLNGVFCIWGTANKHKQLSKWCFKYGKYSETQTQQKIQEYRDTIWLTSALLLLSGCI